MLTKNQLTLLNNLVYKIHTTADLTEMRQTCLETLSLLIDCDMSTFELAADSNSYQVTDPVGLGTNEEEMQYYLDNVQEYDYGRWTYSASSGGVYRETDFMDNAERINTPYYKKFFKPSGIHYSIMLTIIRNQIFYGVLALFRSENKPDFSDRDLFILNLLQDHLGYRLELEKNGGSVGVHLEQFVDSLSDRYNLTRREKEITGLLLQGSSQHDISDSLSITSNTLKKHISNIYKKTGVRSWRELFSLIYR